MHLRDGQRVRERQVAVVVGGVQAARDGRDVVDVDEERAPYAHAGPQEALAAVDLKDVDGLTVAAMVHRVEELGRCGGAAGLGGRRGMPDAREQGDAVRLKVGGAENRGARLVIIESHNVVL